MVSSAFSWGIARPSRGCRRHRPPENVPGGEREAGSAVALALMLLLVLGLALAILSEGVVARMREEQRETRSVRLSAACDAALAMTLAGLASAPTYPGFPARPFGGGTIESEVAPGTSGLRVVARAELGGASRQIEAEVAFSSGRPWVVRWRRIS